MYLTKFLLLPSQRCGTFHTAKAALSNIWFLLCLSSAQTFVRIKMSTITNRGIRNFKRFCSPADFLSNFPSLFSCNICWHSNIYSSWMLQYTPQWKQNVKISHICLMITYLFVHIFQWYERKRSSLYLEKSFCVSLRNYKFDCIKWSSTLKIELYRIFPKVQKLLPLTKRNRIQWILYTEKKDTSKLSCSVI